MGACGGGKSKSKENQQSQQPQNQPNPVQQQQPQPKQSSNPLGLEIGEVGEVIIDKDIQNQNKKGPSIPVLESNAVAGQFDSKQLNSMNNAIGFNFNKQKNDDVNMNFESNPKANMVNAWKGEKNN